MEVRFKKLFSVHIESLLPPTSIELDIFQNVQVAALVGIGLLYQGTGHRHIAEVLLSEIGMILKIVNNIIFIIDSVVISIVFRYVFNCVDFVLNLNRSWEYLLPGDSCCGKWPVCVCCVR